MTINKNPFIRNLFDDVDLESALKQNRRKSTKREKFSFTDHRQATFNAIKNQILEDYCFINNLDKQNLTKEILERIHQRAITIFKQIIPMYNFRNIYLIIPLFLMMIF